MSARSTSPAPGDGSTVVVDGERTTRAGSTVTGLRRTAVLALVTVAVIFGLSVPSWATFSDAATVSTTVATAMVVPPTGLTASTTCKGRTATVTLDWDASTSARVSAYRIRVHLNNAYQDQGTVDAATTTWQGSTDTSYVTNYTMTFTVWTLTDYGWTAESARTARIVC